MGTSKDSETTKKKIIQVAGELFAQQGFKHVTVRDIIDAADANLGALNYHFGTKEALFGEVLTEACRVDRIDERSIQGLQAQDQLVGIIVAALSINSQDIESNWHYALIHRECQFPSHMFDSLVEDHFKRQSAVVTKIVSQIVSKPASSPEVELGAVTLVGLLDMFGLYGPLITKVLPNLTPYLDDKTSLAIRIADLVTEAASRPVD